MKTPFRTWTNFLGSLGFLRRNRRQRQAAANHLPRRSTVRRHAFDTLEARVVLDGDELPIAEFPTIDVRIRSDEQAAIVDTASYTSLAGGYDPDGGSVSIVGGNDPPSQIALMPGQDYSWNYTIADDELNEVNGTITLHGVANNAPIAVDDDYNVLIPYGQTTVRVNLADYAPDIFNDTDADGDQITLVSGGDGEVDIGPEGYSYEYVIDDGWGGTATGTVHIGATQEASSNNAPTPVDDEYTLIIGRDSTAEWVDLSAYQPSLDNDSDPDNDSITLVEYQGPSNVDLLGPGDYSWSYTIEDSSGAQGTASVVLHIVNAENQGPTAGDDDYGTLVIGRDDTGVTIDWSQFAPNLGNDSDPEGDELTVVSFAAPTTPEWVAVGEERTYEYTISDGHGGTATGHVTLRVEAAANQGPTAGDDEYEIVIGRDETSATIDWNNYQPQLSNDSDPEGDGLNVTSFAGGSGGDTLGVGTHSYEYEISDGHGGTAAATVRIIVTNAPNQGPEAQDDSFNVISTGSTSISGSVLANDSDPDQDELTVQAGTITTARGATVTLNADGTFTYTVAPGETETCFTDSFTYSVEDGHGGTATATVNCNAAELPKLTITAEVADTYEPDFGTAPTPGKFRVTRTGDTSAALSFQYTISGTADNNDDYQILLGFGEFAAGAASTIIEVQPIGDALAEGDETVIVELADGEDYDLGATAQATVTIHEAPTLETPANQVHREGAAVQLQLVAANRQGGETFEVTGLPANLAVNAQTGLISGKIGFMAFENQPAAGFYTVVVKLKDAAGGTIQRVEFQWQVTNASLGSFELAEWHHGAADVPTVNGLFVTGQSQSAIYVSPSNFIKLGVWGSSLPEDRADILWATSTGESGSFVDVPSLHTLPNVTKYVAIGIDVNLNGVLDAAEKVHGANMTDLIVEGTRFGAKRTGNGPVESEHYTLKAGEQIEIGGQFEYKFIEADGAKLGTPSLLRYMLVESFGGAPPIKAGTGTDFTHTFVAGEEGLKVIRAYADSNDNETWDEGEEYADSKNFLVAAVKVYTFNLWYSSLIEGDPTNAIAGELAYGTQICLRKDSDEDWRAAVLFQLSSNPSFEFNGGGNTQFSNGVFYTPDNINQESEETALFTLAPDWTIIVVQTNNLSAGVGEGVGDNELIMSYSDHYNTTLAHEIAHLAGAPADHSDGPTNDYIMYPSGNNTATWLQKSTADYLADL